MEESANTQEVVLLSKLQKNLQKTTKRIFSLSRERERIIYFQNSFHCHWLELVRIAPLPIHILRWF